MRSMCTGVSNATTACFRDQYSEILMQKWVGVFNQIFDEDNYTPIMVETDNDYEAVIDKFPFRDKDLEQVCSATC